MVAAPRTIESAHRKVPDNDPTRASQNVVSRYQRRTELIPLFAVPAAELGDYTITTDQYDALITSWNKMPTNWRKVIRQQCGRTGHERIRLEHGGKLCRRCCESVRDGR